MILLVGVICSGALVFEKNNTSDFMMESGDFAISSLTIISDSDNNMNSNFEFDYRKKVETKDNLNGFLERTEKNKRFDYNRIFGNWKTLAAPNKVQWLRTHFKTYPVHGGVLEFVFVLKENEAKDVTYLIKNASLFSQIY